MKWLCLTPGLNFFLSGNDEPDEVVLFANEHFLVLQRKADALRNRIAANSNAPAEPGMPYCGIRFRGEKHFLPVTSSSALSATDKHAVNDLATQLEALLVAHHAGAINRNGLGHVMCNWC